MGLNKAFAFSCMALILTCAGAAKADTFSTGQFVTYTQGDWSLGGAGTPLLTADYGSVYAGTIGELFVGVTGTPGQFFIELDSSGAVLDYLPTAGNAGPLVASLLDPTTSPSGVFGGDVVALKLNVDFSAAGFLRGTSSIPFGNLVLENLPSFDGVNGLTVNQFLALANTCLGGGSCGTSDPVNVDLIALNLEGAFSEGTPNAFADDYLFLPSSGTPAPEPSSLLLLAPALAGLGFLRRRRIPSRMIG